MKRFFIGIAVMSVAVLGLAGCDKSDDSAAASDTIAVEQTEKGKTKQDKQDSDVVAEPVEDQEPTPSGDQTTQEACAMLIDPLTTGYESLVDIDETVFENPAGVVEVWVKLGETFDTYSKTVGNPEIAALAERVSVTLEPMIEVLRRVYVEHDYTALTEMEPASEAFFDAYEDLLQACSML